MTRNPLCFQGNVTTESMFEMAAASHMEQTILPDLDNPQTKEVHKRTLQGRGDEGRRVIWSTIKDDEDEEEMATSMALLSKASRFERLYNIEVAKSIAAEERQNNDRSSHGHERDSTYTRSGRRTRSRSPWKGITDATIAAGIQ